MEVVLGTEDGSAISLEICSLCSSYYEKPPRSFPQPMVNRLICKVLDIQLDGSAYINQHIPICMDCASRVKVYDRKRLELDVLQNEIVSSVLDTLLHIRPNDHSTLHSLKFSILKRWSRGNVPPSMLKAEHEPLQASTLLRCPDPDPPKASIRKRIGTPTHTQRLNQLRGMSEVQQAVAVITAENTKEDNESEEIPTVDITEGSQEVIPEWGGNEESVVTTSPPRHLGIATSTYITEHIAQSNNDEPEDGNSESENEGEDISDDEQSVSTPGKRGRKNTDSGKSTKRKRIRKPPPTAPQHEKPPYFCEACGCVFSQLLPLKRHMSENSCSADEFEKECSICCLNFEKLTWLDVKFHVDEKHPDVKLDKCSFCKREFMPNTITWHQCDGLSKLSATTPTAPKEYKCDYCDKVFYSTGSLCKHMYRNHVKSTDAKPFKCDVCNRAFVSNSLLTPHKATHSETEVLQTCEICGIGQRPRGMREHLKTHNAPKSYVCNACGKGYRYQTILDIHLTSHVDDKNYPCDICLKPFKTAATRRRHWLKHINPVAHGKYEPCPICVGKGRYTKLSTLKKHMLDYHPGSAEQVEICSRRADPEERKKKNNRSGQTTKKAKKGEDSDVSEREDDIVYDEDDDGVEVDNGDKAQKKDPLTSKKQEQASEPPTSSSRVTRGGGKRLLESSKTLESKMKLENS